MFPVPPIDKDIFVDCLPRRINVDQSTISTRRSSRSKSTAEQFVMETQKHALETGMDQTLEIVDSGPNSCIPGVCSVFQNINMYDALNGRSLRVNLLRT